MSSNNNNDGGAIFILAFVGAALLAMAMLAYALACFFALIVTILALLSWNEPLVVGGETLLSPDEARMFVGSGIIGAVGVTGFVYFCSILFGFSFEKEWLFYLLTGGYSFLSIAVMMNEVKEEQAAQNARTYMPVIEHQSVEPTFLPVPKHKEPEFEYASWDDEADKRLPERCRGCAYQGSLPGNYMTREI